MAGETVGPTVAEARVADAKMLGAAGGGAVVGGAVGGGASGGGAATSAPVHEMQETHVQLLTKVIARFARMIGRAARWVRGI